METETIEALLKEKRKFEPPQEFVDQANVKDPDVYKKAEENYEEFWEGKALELDWFEEWDEVLNWDPPQAKWFTNGKLNVSYNCLDRHLDTHRKNKAAIIWEGEPGNQITLTYQDLYRKVNKFANVLKDLGVKKGDRVAIYMPMIPELPIAMLACARIGAPHSIVFSAFSPKSLAERIDDCEANVLITADGYYRGGKTENLKKRADEAMNKTDRIEKCVVAQRLNSDVPMKEERDLFWDDLMKDAHPKCEPEPMDSEDMLFILYTSGTTGKPKGVVHTTGGYLTGVYATSKWVFDLKESDTYWCTADIGWITGHSYIVYGPLAAGATSLMYESVPNYPEPDRFWEIVEKYDVNVFYTAPTAIRAFMKWGNEWPQKHDLSSLRLLGSVGEPINPEAWVWYHKHIGNEKCPIVDTWWQTETGMHMITPLPGITTTKPGSAGFPFPGLKASVVDKNGNEVGENEGGFLVIKRPWPAMLRTVYGNPERYEQYWIQNKEGEYLYFAGDGARRDEDGYLWVVGRIDDVMNVSGHRISTMEVESALVENTSVAEAAVVGRKDEIKGQAIVAFVTLKGGYEESEELVQELRNTVTEVIGPTAKPDQIVFVSDLPKTRSGKIMRRILKDLAEGKDLGDTTTLRDPSVVEEIKESIATGGSK